MNVLYIQNGSSVGGSGYSLDVLIGCLDPARFSVVVWTGENGPMVREWKKHNARVVIQPMYLFEGLDMTFLAGAAESDPAWWRQWVLQILNVGRAVCALPRDILFLRRLQKEHEIRLVHVNSAVALSSGLAARLAGLPVVWHVREILADNVRAKFARWLIAHSSTHIIAISKAAARPFRKTGPPVTVIYNAVDLARFNCEMDGVAARSELGLGSSPVVGYVGKLYPTKGIFDLIAAAPLVRRSIPDAQFLIVGGAPREDPEKEPVSWKHRLRLSLGFGRVPDYAGRLSRLARELGLDECVHLAGSRQDVAKMFAAMDVVALPSHTEAFGRTIVEAMAMAKPVVTTTADAIPELVENGSTGILCKPGSPAELAESIVHLLADPGARVEIGKSARAAVVTRFRSDEHAARVSAIYSSIMGEQAFRET